jgi:hypothetical protein
MNVHARCNYLLLLNVGDELRQLPLDQQSRVTPHPPQKHTYLTLLLQRLVASATSFNAESADPLVKLLFFSARCLGSFRGSTRFFRFLLLLLLLFLLLPL